MEVEVGVEVVSIIIEVTSIGVVEEVGTVIKVSEFELEVKEEVLVSTGIAVGAAVGCTLVLLLVVEALAGSPNTIEEKNETGFGNVTKSA